MTPLLFALVLALPPPPFAENASVSWNENGGIVPLFYLGEENLQRPPVTIARVAPTPTPVAASLMLGDDEVQLDCGSMPCLIPPITSLINDDWTSVRRIRVGVNIEGLSQWDVQHWADPLNHLKATFQTIAAVYLRDFGVDLRIQHVHFEQAFVASLAWINDHSRVDAIWDESIRPLLDEPVHGVIRLVPYPGGHAWPTTCLDDDPFFSNTAGIAGYWFDMDPLRAGQLPINRDRNDVLHTVAHEMGHQFLWLKHTQCYGPGTDGDPFVEQCGSGPAPACATGSYECPPADELSLMGYCYSCRSPYKSPPEPYVDLRFGPAYGDMARVGRHNLNALACLQTVATINLLNPGGDPDGEEYPDAFDNCPAAANNEQTDSDLDGRGDACDSCAIVRPARSAWWLLLAPLALVAAKRGTRRSTQARPSSAPSESRCSNANPI